MPENNPQAEQKNNSLPKDPDDFDQSIDIIQRPGKLWLASLTGVGVITFFWSIFGSIKIEETGPSVFVPEGSVAFARSNASIGTVKELKVEIGDYVKKNQLLAVLNVPSNLKSLKIAENNLDFQKQIEKEKYLSEMVSLDAEINSTNELLNVYEKRLSSAKKLADEKLIPEDRYNSVLEKTSSFKNKLSALQSRKSQLLLRKKEAIESKKITFEREKKNYKLASRVTSPYKGKVISISTALGETIQKGSPLVQVARSNNTESTNKLNLRHIAFFPVEVGKKIRLGMPVLVTPSTVSREEYGGIKGYVADISPFPISKERIKSIVGDASTVDKMKGDQPVLEISLKLLTDNKTPTGYDWTSGNGPLSNISPGLSSTTYINTEIKRPISFALPWIKNTILGKPVKK